jgi:Zn-dependent M16 (insulinase) family peptidase
MLSAPDFSDLKRLQTVIGQVKTSMENSIAGSGHSFAARAAASGLTPAAQLREEWSGLSQLLLIREAAALDVDGIARLAEKFRLIAKLLLHQRNITTAVTAEQRSHANMAGLLQSLIEALPTATIVEPSSATGFTPQPSVIGWTYNLPVAYVTRVFRTLPFTHPDASSLLVLAKLLRANFLHREIREKGGAYGGMAGNDSEGGLFSLLSYRDPHLVRTLDVYKNAIEWACQGDFSDEMIKEAILAVFGELDRPLSPGGRGHREFMHQQQGLNLEMRQTLRDRILATTRDDLARAAQTYLSDNWSESAVGVLAGEEMYAAAEDDLNKLGMQIKKL